MLYRIEAACSSHVGKVRSNNEDNFYFDGKCLPMENNGLRNPVGFASWLKPGLCLAVFDGMGGENYGEVAAFRAAEALRRAERAAADYFIPEKQYLTDLAMKLNEAVVAEAKKLHTRYMGTTMVSLYFTFRYVYVCNLGDSRAYRIRGNEMMQLSEDHVEWPMREAEENNRVRKAPLTQHLGIDPEEILIEPYIAKGEILRGDTYLLCSDGLTDMLTNLEIYSIVKSHPRTDDCVNALIAAALEKGGRDNVTVIVSRIY